jgi:hypothetical protein
MNIIFKVKSRHEESDYAVLNLIPIICTENEATYETSGHGVFVTVPVMALTKAAMNLRLASQKLPITYRQHHP